MRIKIQTLLWIILLTACGATAIHSQETPRTNSAPDSRTIQAAPDGEPETVCEQRLLKTLDALESAEKAIVALKSEIGARESLDKINEELLARKNAIIADQEKLIKILEKQTGRKISLIFGLVKIRY